jgi:hypothetical protein
MLRRPSKLPEKRHEASGALAGHKIAQNFPRVAPILHRGTIRVGFEMSVLPGVTPRPTSKANDFG